MTGDEADMSVPDETGAIVPVPATRVGAKAPLRKADGLTSRQRRAVNALLQESSLARAAILAGVNVRTLHRWMDDPAFQRAYHTARRSAYGQSIGLMQRYSPLAVKTLVDVMNNPKVQAAARVAAAATLLRFGREGIELDDLALRIEALEREAENVRGEHGVSGY